MEFKFSVNDIFKKPIVEISNNLIPPGFTGDRRSFWDIVGKVSEVINAMGEASAAAQGLTKPITTAERLRNSEHTVYLLIDNNSNNGRGAITGMLKTGKKGLYVFDRNGQHYQVSPPCVLDFYIHESRQRTGLGKRLFEHMLQTESIEPVKMAIDRPSEKFLGFLNKHYTLSNPVKQMNNYVVYDGFFPSSPEKNGAVEQDLSGNALGKKQSANGLQTGTYASPLGRYGAPRPPCSMGQIIHNQTSTIPKNTEPTGVRSAPETNYQGTLQSSPGNPTTITQSTPNMYYRSPEQPTLQTQQNGQLMDNNNNLKYYQQLQSNNVWQNFGNVPANVNVDYSKTNFNRQTPTDLYNSYQNNQDPNINNQHMQNYVAQSGDNTMHQSQRVEGQGQTMHQSIPAPPYVNPVSANPNMIQNSSLAPNLLQLQQQPQKSLQNMQQYPAQYSMQPPSGGEMRTNALPQSQVSQNAVPYVVQNVPQTSQSLNVLTPQTTAQVISGYEAVPTQPAILQNNPQYAQNNVQTQPSSNYNVAHQQMVSQQDLSNIQNQLPTYNNLNVTQSQPMVPQQNMTGYGLPANQVYLNGPQASLPNIQSYQSNSNMPMHPTVPQSVPNPNGIPQYHNQMALNQPDVTPNMNVANQMGLEPQYNSTAILANQTSQHAVPATQYISTGVNQPQDISSRMSQTLMQPNRTMGDATNMVNQTMSNPQNPQMTKQSISQQRVNTGQFVPPQNPNIYPETPQYMEGSNLNKVYNVQEKQPVYGAKGDMNETEINEELLKNGYPSQVPSAMKRTPRSQVLSIAGR